MNTKTKYTFLTGVVLVLAFILPLAYINFHHDSSTKYSLLDYKDKKSLDNSIEDLFKKDIKSITVGILGNNRSSYEDYDNEIKEYCSNYGVKTSFIHTDDGSVNAVTLKR